MLQIILIDKIKNDLIILRCGEKLGDRIKKRQILKKKLIDDV